MARAITVGGSYTVEGDVEAVFCDTKGTITLPAGSAGRVVWVVNNGTGATVVTVAPVSGEIKGPSGSASASVELGEAKPLSGATFLSDGVDWHIV